MNFKRKKKRSKKADTWTSPVVEPNPLKTNEDILPKSFHAISDKKKKKAKKVWLFEIEWPPTPGLSKFGLHVSQYRYDSEKKRDQAYDQMVKNYNNCPYFKGKFKFRKIDS